MELDVSDQTFWSRIHSECRGVEGCGESVAGMIWDDPMHGPHSVRCWECAAPHGPERDAADADADRQITNSILNCHFGAHRRRVQILIGLSVPLRALFSVHSEPPRFLHQLLVDNSLQGVTFRSDRFQSARALLLTFLSAEGQALREKVTGIPAFRVRASLESCILRTSESGSEIMTPVKKCFIVCF